MRHFESQVRPLYPHLFNNSSNNEIALNAEGDGPGVDELGKISIYL